MNWSVVSMPDSSVGSFRFHVGEPMTSNGQPFVVLSSKSRNRRWDESSALKLNRASWTASRSPAALQPLAFVCDKRRASCFVTRDKTSLASPLSGKWRSGQSYLSVQTPRQTGDWKSGKNLGGWTGDSDLGAPIALHNSQIDFQNKEWFFFLGMVLCLQGIKFLRKCIRWSEKEPVRKFALLWSRGSFKANLTAVGRSPWFTPS